MLLDVLAAATVSLQEQESEFGEVVAGPSPDKPPFCLSTSFPPRDHLYTVRFLNELQRVHAHFGFCSNNKVKSELTLRASTLGGRFPMSRRRTVGPCRRRMRPSAGFHRPRVRAERVFARPPCAWHPCPVPSPRLNLTLRTPHSDSIPAEDDYFVRPYARELPTKSSETLPLELFDNPEFETTPPEQLILTADGVPGASARSRYFLQSGEFTWKACTVHGYDPEERTFEIFWEGGNIRKRVRRRRPLSFPFS